MKKLRAEIGRLFGRKYVWGVDIDNEITLHRNRGGWCHVYDYTHVGHFKLLPDNATADNDIGQGWHYIHFWHDYETYRDANRLPEPPGVHLVKFGKELREIPR